MLKLSIKEKSMNNIKSRFAKMGIKLPEILIPRDVDMQKWTVVACDQFSSEREYWNKTTDIVGNSPSTLNLILPECFLEDNDRTERVKKINSSMHSYIEKDIFKKLKPGFLIVDRKTPFASSRKGIMISVDLEHYSFDKESKSLIRPTEGTVLERIPPRVEIRENAPLDIPHIVLLINDKKRAVIENTFNYSDSFEEVYDFDLMQNGGQIKGYHISDKNNLEKICSAFENLAEENELLFAVGDGNHSLATAKEIWNRLKLCGVDEEHPARYALVEVTNIFDDGIKFEPIHRVLFNIDKNHFFYFLKENTLSEIIFLNSETEMKQAIYEDSKEHRIGFIHDKNWGYIGITQPEKKLTYEVIQNFIDIYLNKNRDVGIDYIHGDRSVYELGGSENNLGLYLTSLNKSEFFNMITTDGALPRKTFSLGEALEKRFYLESRHLIN